MVGQTTDARQKVFLCFGKSCFGGRRGAAPAEDPPMPGDPEECRAHARRCAELAASAKTPQLRKTLTDLSRSWAHLAAQLEATEALLHHYGQPSDQKDEASHWPFG